MTPAAWGAAFEALARTEPSRVCVGCGCTDGDACVDLDGAPCRWTPGAPFAICSRCARVCEAVANAMHASIGEVDDPPLPDPGEEHFIELASEGEMNRAIAVMRNGGAL